MSQDSLEECSQEEDIPEVQGKRGRGRPRTTGAYEILKEKWAKETEEKEIQKEKDILDPLIKPRLSKSYMDFIERIKDKEEEYKHAPILDLETMISEKNTDIYKVASQSKTMKGTFTKLDKNAAADMCAPTTVLALKAQNPEEITMENQLKELRHELQKLRLENAQLRKMIEQKSNRGKNKEKGEEPPEGNLRLLEARSTRTGRWVRESSPPSVDGGTPVPGQSLAAGAPRPPMDGEFSKTREGGEYGGTLSPVDGVPRNSLQEEGMEVEIFDIEEFSPLGEIIKRGKKSAKRSSLQARREDNAATSKIHTKEEDEERKREENFIAKIEGIVERAMDTRFGCPVLTYAQKKEAERKEKGLKIAEKVSPAPTLKRQAEIQIRQAKSDKTQLLTTLNPPAIRAKPRITVVERVSLQILPTTKKSGGKGKGVKREEKEKGHMEKPGKKDKVLSKEKRLRHGR